VGGLSSGQSPVSQPSATIRIFLQKNLIKMSRHKAKGYSGMLKILENIMFKTMFAKKVAQKIS